MLEQQFCTVSSSAVVLPTHSPLSMFFSLYHIYYYCCATLSLYDSNFITCYALIVPFGNAIERNVVLSVYLLGNPVHFNQ